MTDLKRDVQDDHGTKKMPTGATAEPAGGRPATAGTDRDFDETEVADNQGHGHPREERRERVERRPR
ncbi:MAG TPA: hypothetical protein VF188_18350 [Longimicrobiales bacterium]